MPPSEPPMTMPHAPRAEAVEQGALHADHVAHGDRREQPSVRLARRRIERDVGPVVP